MKLTLFVVFSSFSFHFLVYDLDDDDDHLMSSDTELKSMLVSHPFTLKLILFLYNLYKLISCTLAETSKNGFGDSMSVDLHSALVKPCR